MKSLVKERAWTRVRNTSSKRHCLAFQELTLELGRDPHTWQIVTNLSCIACQTVLLYQSLGVQRTETSEGWSTQRCFSEGWSSQRCSMEEVSHEGCKGRRKNIIGRQPTRVKIRILMTMQHSCKGEETTSSKLEGLC